jgi:hypothetical protein
MQRIRLEFDEQNAPLRARLDDDTLGIDNEIVLVPDKHEPVRVQVSVADAGLREPVERAVSAVRGAVLVEDHPALVITDSHGYRPPSPETWVLRLVIEEQAEAYIGPFVIDRTHPLTEGLSLEGVVWAAGTAEDVNGTPVISAGNVPLVVDAESLGGRHDVRNLIDWRGAQAPGPRQNNVRLGLDVVVTVEPGTESARITSPGGETREVPVHGGRLTVNAAEAGVYRVQAGPAQYAFAANALYKNESDLTGAETGEWGKWPVEVNDRREYRSVAWVLLLACLATMGAHMGLASRRR